MSGSLGASLNSLAEDLSRSTSLSVPELAGLSADEVELIDAVITRAGPDATTFLTIFKAYNDVLSQRGIDPHEVVYYGKLLKLGTLKGSSWRHKWDIVKEHHGYSTPEPPSFQPKPNHIASKRIQKLPDYNESMSMDNQTPLDTRMRSSIHLHSRRSPSPDVSFEVSNPSTSYGVTDHHLQTPHYRHSAVYTRPLDTLDTTDTEDTQQYNHAPSTTPPSYRAAVHEPKQALHRYTNLRTAQASAIRVEMSPVPPPAPRKRLKNILNEEEAWEKVRLGRDEKDADRFRNERLIERCWEAWRQGYDWIATTTEQIEEARNNLLLRVTMQQWKERMVLISRRETQLKRILDQRLLRRTLKRWRVQTKEKIQSEWRNSMRHKIQISRQRREDRLRKDAWAKWRQSWKSHLSDLHYAERLVLRFWELWKRRTLRLEHSIAIADQFRDSRIARFAEHCWDSWRRSTELQIAGRLLTVNSGHRLKRQFFNTWNDRLHVRGIASSHYRVILMKASLRSWKTKLDRIRSNERRADGYFEQRQKLLLSVVARVWKTKERGQLLQRVKAKRLLTAAWLYWTKNVERKRSLYALALRFSNRPAVFLTESALQQWKRVYLSHRNAAVFSSQYHSSQLKWKMLHQWRLRFYVIKKSSKRAKGALKFMKLRFAFRRWMQKSAELQLEKKLVTWHRAKVKKNFDMWRARSKQSMRLRRAGDVIQAYIEKRIIKNVLNLWTDRVIDIKSREYEVVQERESSLVSQALNKWRSLLDRHIEELSLMESYQLVKQEERIRRAFHRWLSAARKVRHRRSILDSKEKELCNRLLLAAWEVWIDRYHDERLRPVEVNLHLQTQRGLLFRAFGVWHSKTKALPAIRLHSDRLKVQVWTVWVLAIPRALQNRRAREWDKNVVLPKAFSKWIQTYRNKLALRAVARARYLRLPMASERIPVTPLNDKRIFPSQGRISRPSSYPRSEPADLEEDGDIDDGESRASLPAPRPMRAHATGFLGFETRSPRSFETPRAAFPVTRPSPMLTSRSGNKTPVGLNEVKSRTGRSLSRPASSRAASSIEGDGQGKSRLWLELQEVRRKSRPPSPDGYKPP